MTRNDEVPGVIPTPCLKRVPLSKTREAVLSDPARLGDCLGKPGSECSGKQVWVMLPEAASDKNRGVTQGAFSASSPNRQG